MFGFLPVLGRYQQGREQTQAAGTAITALIPPMKGAVTHLDNLVILAGTTAHNIYLLRPLNYTTLSAAAAAAQAVVNLTADPGLFTTNYMYPLLNSGPNGQVPATLPTFRTANDGVAAGDYLVFETPDGAFYYDFIASVDVLAVTMTNNLPTGGLLSGARVWHMGQFGDTDPATNLGQFYLPTTDSVLNSFTGQSGANNDFFQTLHPYDPVLLYDANATNADTLQRLEGYFSKF